MTFDQLKYRPDEAAEDKRGRQERGEDGASDVREIASAPVVDLKAYREAKDREASRSDRVEEAKEAAARAAANEDPHDSDADPALEARMRGIKESDRQTRARMEMWETQGPSMPEVDLRGLIGDLHADDLVDFTADEYFAAGSDKRRLLGLQGSKRDSMNRKIQAKYKKLEWGIEI